MNTILSRLPGRNQTIGDSMRAAGKPQEFQRVHDGSQQQRYNPLVVSASNRDSLKSPFAYQYLRGGQLSFEQNPFGRQLSYEYNNAGQAKSVARGAKARTRSYISILLMLVTFGTCAFGSGPGAIEIGPYSNARQNSLKTLLELLGRSPMIGSNHFCFASVTGNGFVWFDRMAHGNQLIGDILLSDFSNCIDQKTNITKERLEDWKTERVIGLGSKEQEVIAAYGKPTRIDRIAASTYRWVVHGAGAGAKPLRMRGDLVLVYRDAETGLQTSEFGLRGGTVAWIFLSNNE